MRYIINGTSESDGIKNDLNKNFYWSNPTGKISLYFAYNEISGCVNEINTFGINLRLGIIEKWIREGKNIYYVLLHLADAVFDPEFFRICEGQIISKFN